MVGENKNGGIKGLIGQAKTKLPAIIGSDHTGLPTAYGVSRKPPVSQQPRQLTSAAIIYTIGAGILFMMAIYNLLHGSYFNGVVIFIPTGSLLVLAYKYLQ